MHFNNYLILAHYIFLIALYECLETKKIEQITKEIRNKI